MTFLVAWRLWFLVVVGAFVGAWLAAIFRRRADVVRFTDVALLDVVAPQRSAWRRHLPAALWLLAVTLLVLGFARPARDVEISRDAAVVILAMDVSLSMEADDVRPSRLDAAKEAAVTFMEGLPDKVDVGLVLFSGSTAGYAPSEDRETLIDIVNGAELGEYTAIGDAIFRGVDLIETSLQDQGVVLDEDGSEGSGGDGDRRDETGDEQDQPVPRRIVVLSDGETTTGRPNEEGAAAAVEAHVAVDTISFGTPEGVIEDFGVVEPVPVAPGPLQEIAETTGGEFYEAESLDELSAAYQDIATVYTTETERRDISGWFLGPGLLLLAVAGGLSLLWSQRLP